MFKLDQQGARFTLANVIINPAKAKPLPALLYNQQNIANDTPDYWFIHPAIQVKRTLILFIYDEKIEISCIQIHHCYTGEQHAISLSIEEGNGALYSNKKYYAGE